MRIFDNMKISWKIICIITLMAVTTVFVTIMLSQRLTQTDERFSGIIAQQVPARIETGRFNKLLQQMLYMSYRVLTYDGESQDAKSSEKLYKAARDESVSTLDKLIAADPANTAGYTKAKQGFAELTALTDKAVAAGMKNENDTAKDILAKADKLVDPLNDEIFNFNEAEYKKMTDTSNALTAETEWSIRLGYITGLGGLIFAAAVGIWIASAKISAPINQLSSTMGRLARGDLEIAIEGQDRKDEIGTMSGAVISFKVAALERVRLEAEAATARQQADQERAAREAEKLEESRQDQLMIETLAGSLARMADGDLAFQIEQVFAQKVERLRTDFNTAIAKLQQAMQTISTNTDALHSGAGEIATASDDLARRTEQQAASLEETTAALNEVTQTVKKTAEGAKHARAVVSAAKSEADASSGIVREAILSMGEIEKSSNQISQIIGVIDEIAFQTNLLALNAGVEAARAGEAGRGFAVVASEVRALAQRSAEAAKEIKGLISASSAQVSHGVDRVTETGKALNKIVEQVVGISQIVSEIAESAQTQASALQEVNVAVNQMDQMTQQNAAMVEETTAAARSLDQQCNELKHLVGQFETYAGNGSKRRNVSQSRAAA